MADDMSYTFPADDPRVTVEAGYVDELAGMFANETGLIETPKLILEGDDYEIELIAVEDMIEIRRLFDHD